MNQFLEIFLIRHGEVVKPFPDAMVGQTDLVLSEIGEGGVENLAQKLAEKELEVIFHSPLKRCVQSSTILLKYHDVQCVSVDCLQEISLGDWDGMGKGQIRKQYPQEFKERGQDIAFYAPPNGESFSTLQNRVWPCFVNIAQDCRAKKYNQIGIVAHAGVNRVILSKIMKKSLYEIFSIQQDYSSCTCIYFDGKRFSC